MEYPQLAIQMLEKNSSLALNIDIEEFCQFVLKTGYTELGNAIINSGYFVPIGGSLEETINYVIQEREYGEKYADLAINMLKTNSGNLSIIVTEDQFSQLIEHGYTALARQISRSSYFPTIKNISVAVETGYITLASDMANNYMYDRELAEKLIKAGYKFNGDNFTILVREWVDLALKVLEKQGSSLVQELSNSEEFSWFIRNTLSFNKDAVDFEQRKNLVEKIIDTGCVIKEHDLLVIIQNGYKDLATQAIKKYSHDQINSLNIYYYHLINMDKEIIEELINNGYIPDIQGFSLLKDHHPDLALLALQKHGSLIVNNFNNDNCFHHLNLADMNKELVEAFINNGYVFGDYDLIELLNNGYFDLVKQLINNNYIPNEYSFTMLLDTNKELAIKSIKELGPTLVQKNLGDIISFSKLGQNIDQDLFDVIINAGYVANINDLKYFFDLRDNKKINLAIQFVKKYGKSFSKQLNNDYDFHYLFSNAVNEKKFIKLVVELIKADCKPDDFSCVRILEQCFPWNDDDVDEYVDLTMLVLNKYIDSIVKQLNSNSNCYIHYHSRYSKKQIGLIKELINAGYVPTVEQFKDFLSKVECADLAMLVLKKHGNTFGQKLNDDCSFDCTFRDMLFKNISIELITEIINVGYQLTSYTITEVLNKVLIDSKQHHDIAMIVLEKSDKFFSSKLYSDNSYVIDSTVSQIISKNYIDLFKQMLKVGYIPSQGNFQSCIEIRNTDLVKELYEDNDKLSLDNRHFTQAVYNNYLDLVTLIFKNGVTPYNYDLSCLISHLENQANINLYNFYIKTLSGIIVNPNDQFALSTEKLIEQSFKLINNSDYNEGKVSHSEMNGKISFLCNSYANQQLNDEQKKDVVKNVNDILKIVLNEKLINGYCKGILQEFSCDKYLPQELCYIIGRLYYGRSGNLILQLSNLESHITKLKQIVNPNEQSTINNIIISNHNSNDQEEEVIEIGNNPDNDDIS
ncbi:MAG: hypothetical protein HRU35_07780 [Rickettsiaceae bacterium]|nr:hypothetical protein [Rickettsiaceae bacterium]